jgi:hypothetical protein
MDVAGLLVRIAAERARRAPRRGADRVIVTAGGVVLRIVYV